MKFLLSFFTLWVVVTSTHGCSTLTEGWESVVDCSDAADISEVKAYMEELSASFSVFHNKFRIVKNPNIIGLDDDLFGNIQFLTVEISDCSNLSYVGDFLGASRATLGKFIFSYNKYTSIPALNAPYLRELLFNSFHPQVDSSIFTNMESLEIIILSGGHIHPMAFYDLKYLRQLTVAHQPSTFRNLTAGTLKFDSPSLQMVDLVYAYFDNIEPGSIEGFPPGSIFLLRTEQYFKKEAFFNLLDGGAKLEIHKNVFCGCNVAWIRLGPYLSQTRIPCARPNNNAWLHNIPAEEFAHCEI